jgi:hypothetical protein
MGIASPTIGFHSSIFYTSFRRGLFNKLDSTHKPNYIFELEKKQNQAAMQEGGGRLFE